MDNVIIKNGICVEKNDKYSIYQMYTDRGKEYYMCLPNNHLEKYEMVVDFKEDYYSMLLEKDLHEEIKVTYDKLYEEQNNRIYILTNVTVNDLEEALENNDDHSYQVLLRNIQKYTRNAYKTLIDEFIEIDQTINIMIDTDNDKKFINWLDVNFPGYFKPLTTFSENKEEELNVAIETIKEENEVKKKKKQKKSFKNKMRNKKGFGNSLFISLLTVICVIVATLAIVLCTYVFIK